jgi:hypothetical protein
MNNRVSILYTYRNPWPRRLAFAAAIVLLLGATKFTTARFGTNASPQGCAGTAAR